MREHGGDGEAARALHVHEERVRALDQTLQLVAAHLLLVRGVNEINSESLKSKFTVHTGLYPACSTHTILVLQQRDSS